MHTICRYCRVGERFVDQESRCWVIQQQKMIRMKVHVLSDSTLCVGVSNSGPSQNWVTKLEDVCNEHGFVEISIWQPEKCNSFGTFYRVLVRLISKNVFRFICTGSIHNHLRNGSYYCQCSTMLMRHHKRKCRAMFAQRQRSGRVFGEVQGGTLVIFGTSIQRHLVEGKFQQASRNVGDNCTEDGEVI